MSTDIVLKHTKRNWARGACEASSPNAAPSDKSRLEALAKILMAAESGDKKAQKQWKKICKKVDALRKKAKKGDPVAQLDLRKLENSGLFGHMQKIAVSGWKNSSFNRRVNAQLRKVGQIAQLRGAFVGEEELALASEGGSCEREALSRRTGLSGALPSFVRNMASQQHRGRRGQGRRRKLQRLERKTAQGDPQATAKLQLIKTRLQQKAAAGDTRAQTLIQRIDQQIAAYKAQPGLASSFSPTATDYATRRAAYIAALQTRAAAGDATAIARLRTIAPTLATPYATPVYAPQPAPTPAPYPVSYPAPYPTAAPYYPGEQDEYEDEPSENYA
jgi:hypothetical protein